MGEEEGDRATQQRGLDVGTGNGGGRSVPTGGGVDGGTGGGEQGRGAAGRYEKEGTSKGRGDGKWRSVPPLSTGRDRYPRADGGAGHDTRDHVGRGLHSSTSQLNLSRLCHSKHPLNA